MAKAKDEEPQQPQVGVPEYIDLRIAELSATILKAQAQIEELARLKGKLVG